MLRDTMLGAGAISTIREIAAIDIRQIRAFGICEHADSPAVLLYACFAQLAFLVIHKRPIQRISKNAWFFEVFRFGIYAYRMIAPAIYRAPTQGTASSGLAPGRSGP